MRASTTLWGGGSLSLGLEGDKGKKKDTKTVHSSEAWRSRNEAKREERKREEGGGGWTGLRRRKGRKMERVVVVALGDRKCVKLQRSVILMTPNDTAPSVHGSFPPPGTVWIPSTTSEPDFLPTGFLSSPSFRAKAF